MVRIHAFLWTFYLLKIWLVDIFYLFSCLKMTSPKMEDDLNQNRRRPHPKWKTTSPKTEDDLTQNGKRPNTKWKMTPPKNEDV